MEKLTETFVLQKINCCVLIVIFHYRMGNELQEARSSEDDLEHPPIKKNKRDLTEDSNGKLMLLLHGKLNCLIRPTDTDFCKVDILYMFN